MSQNTYTGLESMSKAELVSECFRTFDDFVHRPIEMELAKRLDEAIGSLELLDKYAALDLGVDDVRALQDAMIDNTTATIELLKILAEYEIDGDNTEYLRAALKAADIINKAA